MSQNEPEIQTPKEWKRFANAVGRVLPKRMVETRRTAKRIRALGGQRKGK